MTIIISHSCCTFANSEIISNPIIDNHERYFTQCTEEIPNKNHLLIDWHQSEPYQFSRIANNGSYVVTGLDVELINAISNKINIDVQYTNVVWEHSISNIQHGSSDMISGAFYTIERSNFANFSLPYRFEEISLFTLRSSMKRLNFNNANEFLAQIRLLNFRLGIINQGVYGDTKTTNYLNQLSNNDIIIKYNNNAALFNGLLRNEIDGFLADRITGVALALNYTKKDQVEEIPTGIKTPVHLMFSKKTVPSNLVAHFNDAIKEYINSHEYKKMVKSYIYQILLTKSINSEWGYIIGVIGSIAFAISGIIISSQTNSSLFITFVLAMLPSLLGCAFLDAIILQRPNSMNFVLIPYYTFRVFVTVLVGFFTIKLLDYYNKQLYEDNFIQKIWKNTIVICDSIGQACFMVIGVVTVVIKRIEPLEFWAPCFGCITSSVGILFRKLLCNHDKTTEYIPREINFEIFILWGAILSLLLDSYAYYPNNSVVKYSIIASIVGAFISKILVYYYKIPNLIFRFDNA